ncbi:hypothetical protein LTR97_010238 [Elasticomyces elasticus]|uniref:Methyltransferase type 11 domain-containing protein n=1 Tax=Elasticomyces elasticus TaxID=574655 RepID=A0AAN7W1P1_9PEZI|nr:hypothetical protein LTR97_010238 [Elasticomyces elasticus]
MSPVDQSYGSASCELSTVPPNHRVVLTNEKVTGPAAAQLIRRSGILDVRKHDLEVLDNATGGGILVAELFRLAEEQSGSLNFKRVVAGDIDDSMLRAVQIKKDDTKSSSLWGKVEPMKIDQQAIPMPDGSFTHLFNNMGIFFCQDDEKALREAHRVLKSGGVASFTSWKSIAWWEEIAQPAIKQFIPGAPELPGPANLFPSRGWSDPAVIPSKLEKAGFSDVQVDEFKFTPNVEAEEFAEAFGVLVKIVAKRLWSDEHCATYAPQIEPALRRYLEENYASGRWTGKMIAITTVGRKT